MPRSYERIGIILNKNSLSQVRTPSNLFAEMTHILYTQLSHASVSSLVFLVIKYILLCSRLAQLKPVLKPPQSNKEFQYLCDCKTIIIQHKIAYDWSRVKFVFLTQNSSGTHRLSTQVGIVKLYTILGIKSKQYEC